MSDALLYPNQRMITLGQKRIVKLIDLKEGIKEIIQLDPPNKNGYTDLYKQIDLLVVSELKAQSELVRI